MLDLYPYTLSCWWIKLDFVHAGGRWQKNGKFGEFGKEKWQIWIILAIIYQAISSKNKPKYAQISQNQWKLAVERLFLWERILDWWGGWGKKKRWILIIFTSALSISLIILYQCSVGSTHRKCLVAELHATQNYPMDSETWKLWFFKWILSALIMVNIKLYNVLTVLFLSEHTTKASSLKSSSKAMLSSKAMQPSLVKKLVGLLSQTFVFWTTKYRTIFIPIQAIRGTNILGPTYYFVLWIFEKFTYNEKVWAAYGHSTSHCCRGHQVKNVSRNLGPKKFCHL